MKQSFRRNLVVVTMVGVFIFMLSEAGCKKAPQAAAKNPDQTQQKENTGTPRPNDFGHQIGARVGSEIITKAMLEEYLAIRPMPQYTKDVNEIVRVRLQELITGEVLRQEALRLKMDRQPGIRYRIQQLLAQSLMEEQVDKPLRESKITDEDVQAYYDEHLYEFSRSAQMRLADIFVAAGPSLTSQERLERKKKAEEALAEALEIESKASGFGELVAKYSDSPQNYPRGNTGFFDIKGQPVGLDAKLAEDAFKLARIGKVCDHVIEAADGYHIVMLISKRSAASRPLEEVEAQLRRRIRQEKLERARQDYIKKLKDNCGITVDSDIIAEISESMKATLIKQTPGKGGPL